MLGPEYPFHQKIKGRLNLAKPEILCFKQLKPSMKIKPHTKPPQKIPWLTATWGGGEEGT
jgi:hypothetical protein